MITASIIIRIDLEWYKDSLLIIIMSIKLLITVLTALIHIRSQEIVDYSHSTYLQRSQALPHHNYNIDIHPNRDNKEYLEFPSSCELQNSLSVTALVQQNQRILDSEEKQIQRLKNNMTYLLKLSQNIKKLKSFLRQYTFQEEQIKEAIQTSQIQLIGTTETSLKQKRQLINKLILNLAQFIHKQLHRAKKNGWDGIHLEFQQKIHQSRYNYLLKVKQSLQKGQEHSQSNYHQFFKQIQRQMDSQNQQMLGVGQLLGNFSFSNEIKLKISSLESQLQAINLMIKQKQQCILKKDEYTSESRNHFLKTYRLLKELKDMQNPNHQFCQGVAASLLKQLKKLLKVYNYSFVCSEGFSDLQNKRFVLVIELQRLNKIYNEIDYNGKVENIKKYLAKKEDLRSKLIQQINSFKLNHYTLNITTVERQILTTKQKIAQIELKLNDPNAGKEDEINYDQIKQIIITIEKQQHTYCVLKDQYQKKYRNVDVTLRSIEYQSKLRASHYSKFVDKYNQLRQLQREFVSVKNSIAEQLK